MLLIAQPKSWSSSLLTYMQKVHKLRALQRNLKCQNHLKISLQFPKMGDLHCCCVNVNQQTIEHLIKSKEFYRQHIPPTETNLQLLLKYKDKIAVLLRKPIESYYAYFRGMKKGYHPQNIDMYSPELLQELEMFYHIYKKLNFFVIESPLTNEKINAIEKFYGLKETPNPISLLPKEKYTR